MAKPPKTNKPKGKPRPQAAAPARAGRSQTAPPKRIVPKPKVARSTAKSRVVVVKVPQHITLDLPPALHDRLKSLSQTMDLPMEAVIRQALMEFADTWEEHHRTVAALAEGSDRVQLAMKD